MAASKRKAAGKKAHKHSWEVKQDACPHCGYYLEACTGAKCYSERLLRPDGKVVYVN